MSFIDSFNSLYENFDGSDNDTETTVCTSKIDHQKFHTFLLIPSGVMILVLAFTISRKNKALGCFYGRPGAVFPMDILGKSHRFSYAAAWGSVAFLASEMVFNQLFALKLSGPPIVTAMNAVLSMVIYGIDYFPLFAALALESMTGYLVGTAYAWMLLGVNIYKATECDLTYQARLVYVLRDVPNFLCLGYLSISLPIRMGQAFIGKTTKLLSSSEMVSILNTTKKIGTSPEGQHVKNLLTVQPPPPPDPTTVTGKIVKIARDIFAEWVYRRQSDFRYSARIMSVMFIGVLLLYKVTLEFMVIVLSILQLIERGFVATLDVVGWVAEASDSAEVAGIREGIFVLYYLLVAGRACFITAMSVALFMGLLNILHTMTSYRNNLFDLYKGNNEHIPHRSTRSSASLLVGAMRYAGYQVGYIAWGFAIHFLILLIVALALATIITLIREGYYEWIFTILLNAWPALLMTLIFTVGQLIVAKVVFTQGDDLALDNRRFLFTFTFFMFFYNIFIGLVSCLLRIIKSIGVGAFFLPRLDNSALPRRFQMLDPGFAAYVGFIHIEASHTHPVLVVFLRLLLLDQKARQTGIDPRDTRVVDMDSISEKEKENNKLKWKPRVSARARSRWFLLYTLYNNPALRSQRKQYINYIKMLRERLARHYNMNHSAMGKMMKNMNKTMASIGTEMAPKSVENGGPNKAKANWNAMLGMSRFMMSMQNRGGGGGMVDPSMGMELAMLEMGNAMIDEEIEQNPVVDPINIQPKIVNAKPNLWKRAAMGALSTKQDVEKPADSQEQDTSYL